MLDSQGAKLVETVEDIFEELGQFNQIYNPVKRKPADGLDLEQQNLLKLIPYSPITVDNLVQDSICGGSRFVDALVLEPSYIASSRR